MEKSAVPVVVVLVAGAGLAGWLFFGGRESVPPEVPVPSEAPQAGSTGGTTAPDAGATQAGRQVVVLSVEGMT